MMDEKGRVLSSATAEHKPFESPQPGWAEQDPYDWWAACGNAVRTLLRHSATGGAEIARIALSGQMHGAVLLDAHHHVIRPAIIWCDQRSEKQARELAESIGTDCLIRLTCNPPLPNFTLTKLLWVREAEPENWARVRHILLPKDYVRFR